MPILLLLAVILIFLTVWFGTKRRFRAMTITLIILVLFIALWVWLTSILIFD